MNRVIAASSIVVVVALATAFSASPGIASRGVPAGLASAIHARFGAGAVHLNSAVKANSPAPEALFGYSVSLSADGTTALVGAPYTIDGGEAYIFHVSDAGSWVSSGTPTATLTNPGNPFDLLGDDVALSADGTTAFVGDPFGGIFGDGAVYVFHVASEDAWASSSTPTATLQANHGICVGDAIAVSTDGTTLLMGDPCYAGFGGGAYVFHVASENAWVDNSVPMAALSNLAESIDDGFAGETVALSGDGTTALLSDAESGTGGAYIFHVATPTAWTTSSTPTAILTDSNSGTQDFLGYGLAFSGDGKTAFLGAPNAGDGTGSVDVFHTSSEGAWADSSTPAATLTDAGGVSGDILGLTMAANDDGTTLLASAPGVADFTGVADVFHASDASAWATTSTPNAVLSDSNGVDNDALGVGYALGLSSDGATAFVGAPGTNHFIGDADVWHVSDASSWGSTSTPTATLTNDALLNELCTVPSLKGKTIFGAEDALFAAGCQTGLVTNAYSSTVKRGRVISQNPKAGNVYAFGAKVNFRMSLGPFHH